MLIAYVFGTCLSGLASKVGIQVATITNITTAEAA